MMKNKMRDVAGVKETSDDEPRQLDEAAVDHVQSVTALQRFEDVQRKIAQYDQRIGDLSRRRDEIASLRAEIHSEDSDPSSLISGLEEELNAIRLERSESRKVYEEFTDKIIQELFDADRDARAQYEVRRKELFTPEELAKMELQIEEIYNKKPLWHGTGRFRYAFTGESKYHGVDYEAPKVDVLASILKTGLQPQYDPWGVKASGKSATLSLTEQRMLARVVAEARLPEGEELEYEFGTSRFWWLLLMKKEGLENLMVHKDALPTAQTSMSELNSAIQHAHPNNYVDVYTGTRSTIAENYPVIFCLKNDAVQARPLKDMAVSKNLEQRATIGSGLESVSHIEVPIRNVRETQELLRSLNIDLSIIPVEEWERWMGKMSEKIYASQGKG